MEKLLHERLFHTFKMKTNMKKSSKDTAEVREPAI